MADIDEVLERNWGYKQFRPLQEDIIRSVLNGKDTLALLPTGGGKSICFQVPAMAKDGICIVVSPLIALMKDQVQNLEKKGIKARAIYSGMSFHEINLTLDNCIHGDIKFLYLSPERLKSDLVKERVAQMDVNLLAIDEAHCISQWGYDFRPEYLAIAEIRELLSGVPVLALTASATPQVVKDIQERLQFPKPNVYVKSFERSNIAYVVNHTESKYDRLVHILKRVSGSGLVYVRNRKKTQDLADFISRQGIRSDFYHAGLPYDARASKQDDWIRNKTRIMVCTNAFGMGIDKPDVRLVVHFEMPDSLESYYQEAGRAGRDEQKAYAVLLYGNPDAGEARTRLGMNYPEIADISRVYRATCNYYSMPVGGWPDRSFDFDIDDFTEKFKLQPALTYTSLKALESAGLLLLNEHFFEPSKLHILAHHDVLYKFQVENPPYDDFIKLLMRSYGGLFEQYVTIDEQALAKRGRTEIKLIKNYLLRLHQLGLVDYRERKDKPQLTFMQQRIGESSIPAYLKPLSKRKKIAAEKLDAMLEYATNESVCRSRKLVAYFDEYGTHDCGVCDICLQQKKMQPPAADFEQLIEQIRNLSAQPLTIYELIGQIGEEREKDAMEAVRFLLDNDKLRYNAKQQLEWKH